MTAQAGMDVIIRVDGVPVAGLRTGSVTREGSAIDVSSATSAGLRKLLEGRATGRGLAISGEGVEDGTTLRVKGLSSVEADYWVPVEFQFPEGDVIAGTFFMASYEAGAPYEEGITFSASFTSSGAWTYTAAT